MSDPVCGSRSLRGIGFELNVISSNLPNMEFSSPKRCWSLARNSHLERAALWVAFLKEEACAATVAPSVDEQTRRAQNIPWVAGGGPKTNCGIRLLVSTSPNYLWLLSSFPLSLLSLLPSSALFIGPSLALLLLHIGMRSRCVTGHVYP